MQTHKLLAALSLAALPVLVTAPAHADTVNFSLTEQNSSGAQAQAMVTTRPDGSMTVKIDGTGFTPGAPHAQHLHGAPEGGFFCPSPSADKNGDGQVATEEGVAQYGGVMVSLTTRGDASADSGLAVDRMPVADADGNLSYQRTIPASDIPDGVVDNVENLHIVQHGLDVNGNDEYDMAALGESKFAASLGVEGIPEEATNPATCGEVTPVGAVETGGAGTTGMEATPLLAAGAAAAAAGTGLLLLRRRTERS